MAEDVAQDANDDFVTVKDAAPVEPAVASDSVVDPEAPPAEPVPHDPDVKIPGDAPEDVETVEDPVTELVHHQHATANVSPIAKTGEKDVKGTFRGHAALQAERQANEAALVALRKPEAV